MRSPAYKTHLGACYCGDSLELLAAQEDSSVNLVLTSPPFALLRKKEYGNKEQHEYEDWLCTFGKLVRQKLRDDGSFVLDLGGAYERGAPSRSLYNFRVLIRFCDDLGFFLAEDFYWHNPSKLPSPIEWVNKRKIRVKDTVNTVWWFSKTEWRKWLSYETDRDYVAASVFRFLPEDAPLDFMRDKYHEILKGECVDLSSVRPMQENLFAASQRLTYTT